MTKRSAQTDLNRSIYNPGSFGAKQSVVAMNHIKRLSRQVTTILILPCLVHV
jgi:hypothetical protein